MSNNVIRGGFRRRRRKKEDLRDKVLRCEITERWLQFPIATDRVTDVDYMRIEVMTRGSDDQPRKLCELTVNRTMLLELLDKIPTIDHRDTENDEPPDDD